VPWINIVHSPRLDARLHKARQSLPYQSAFLKESFSDELWQAMEQRGLNQAQFAEKADVSKQFLTKVFRGGNCTMETIAKLVFALNFRAHIHLTPNEVGCEWIHQVPWTIPQSFNAYTDFFIGTKYHSVNRIEKEMDYAAVTSDS
jgi:DNA-binding phage protein